MELCILYSKSCLFAFDKYANYRPLFLKFICFLALETVIYFEDKKGVILHVEDGQNAEAGTAVATNKF